MAVCMLSGECEQRRDPQGHPGWDGLGLDPEGDPGHHDDQAGRDVGVEKVVAEATAKLEYNL